METSDVPVNLIWNSDGMSPFYWDDALMETLEAWLSQVWLLLSVLSPFYWGDELMETRNIPPSKTALHCGNKSPLYWGGELIDLLQKKSML